MLPSRIDKNKVRAERFIVEIQKHELTNFKWSGPRRLAHCRGCGGEIALYGYGPNLSAVGKNLRLFEVCEDWVRQNVPEA